MENEKTDVKEGQVVTDPAVSQSDTGKAVSQSGTDKGVSQTTTDKGVSQVATDKSVPYERFKEINDAKNESDARVAALEAERAALIARMETKPQSQDDPYVQTLKRLGLENEPYLTTEQNGQVFNQMLNMVSVQTQREAFIAAHPDFGEVVGSINASGNFVPAAPMRRVFEKYPQAARAILNGPNAPQAIYELVTMDMKTLNPIEAEKQAASVAKDAINAANRQASISEAATGGGTLDKAAMIKGMSDEEFAEYKAKITARAG